MLSLFSSSSSSGMSEEERRIEQQEQNLTTEEKSITNVVRKAGPSVAFVTSVWPERRRPRSRRTVTIRAYPFRLQQQIEKDNVDDDDDETDIYRYNATRPPPGRGLGTGSGFVVDSRGYVVTNYHVIERAYQIQEALKRLQQSERDILSNVTQYVESLLGIDNNNNADVNVTQLLEPFVRSSPLFISDPPPSPQVYCRINSDSRYWPCRIVDVVPSLDIAVLEIMSKTETTTSIPDDYGVIDITPKQNVSFQPISFGSSTDLVVGQTVVAIGNPFGLEQTVTKGVVSALNRNISTSISSKVANCIQTDAAINPGNSGGPLLNLQGQVIGVNNAIITTSGSNAGIGFALPSNQVGPVVQDIMTRDLAEKVMQQQETRGFLGVGLWKAPLDSDDDNDDDDYNWIVKIQPNSPAARASLRAITISPEGRVMYGDKIVALNGNAISNYNDLVMEMEERRAGESISLTVQNAAKEERIVDIRLEEKPNSTR